MDYKGSYDSWDYGYPSGGNFWWNYNATDNCGGPQQDVCTGPDGIGDTPFGLDRYPLMKPYPVQINPPVSFDFSLSTPSPSSLTVAQGGTSPSSWITAALVNAPSYGYITFTTSSLTNGVTAAFTRNPCPFLGNVQGTPLCIVSVSFSATTTATVGTPTVTITADSEGVSHSTSISRTVTAQHPASPPGVTVSPPTPNPASTVSVGTVASSVSGSSTVTGITVNWGDGTAADNLAGTARSDSHVYTSTGTVKSKTFKMTVTATNSAGPGSGTTTEVVNDLLPVVTISSVAPTSPCVGQSVTVSFASTDPDGTVASNVVSWGDGTAVDNLPGTATSDTHTYTVGDAFAFSVTATDDSGSTGQGTGSITTVLAGCVPTVTVNTPTPNPVSTGQLVTVTFTVTSTSTVNGVTVNWGDGTTNTLLGTVTMDSHTYASTGNVKSATFTITVTATNSAGPGSGTTTEVVNDLPPAVTVSNVSPNPANTGQLVTVTFAGTDPDGTVSSITVSWGDGSAVDTLGGGATSDTHTYTTASTFTITVTATDNSGSTGQATGSVTTVVPVGAPTVTVNNPTPNPADTGATVTVVFTVSSTAPVTVVSVDWGDGTTNSLSGSATSDTHSYSSTGTAKSQTFTITVTATNSAGPGSGSTTETVNDRPPVASFTFTPINPSGGQAVNFDATASTDPDGTITSYAWDFGDGTSGTGATQIHIYNPASTMSFTVSLTLP